jgi:WD40 repeat protein
MCVMPNEVSASKKGRVWVYLLLGCLGLSGLGCAGVVAVVVALIASQGTFSVDERLVGVWVIDRSGPFVPEDRRDLRWEFNNDGTCTQRLGGVESSASWYRVSGNDRSLQIRVRWKDGRPSELINFTFEHSRLRPDAPFNCLLRRDLAVAQAATRRTELAKPTEPVKPTQPVKPTEPAKPTPPVRPGPLVELDDPKHLIVRTDNVLALALSPNGRTLSWYEAGPQQMLRVWALKGGGNVDVLLKPELPDGQSYGGVSFSPDGKTVATGISTGRVRFFDTTTGEARPDLEAHTAPVTAVAYAGTAALVSTARDGEVKRWDLVARKATATVKARPGLTRVGCSADGRLAVTLSATGLAQLWDLDAAREITAELPADARAFAVALAPDGKTAAVGLKSGDVILLDPSTGKALATLSGHKGPVGGLAFSDDSRLLATGSADRTARIWSVTAQQARFVVRRHDKGVLAVALSNDGGVLATTGEDKAIYTWNLPARR